MLPASARLTSGEDFAEVIRRGRRAGRGLLVVHALVPGDAPRTQPPTPRASPECLDPQPTQDRHGARVGFVVSKAVGGSVVRHRVARRLRHVLRGRLDQLPAGTRLVVRALPPAAAAESSRLAAEVDRALRAVLPGEDRR